VIGHGDTGRLADVAVPLALQFTVVDPESVPDAVPANWMSPHVALNDPVAVVNVCCVGFQWKLVQVDGEGMTPDALETDCHDPMRASMPVAVGPVTLVLCSKPKQPAAATEAASASATRECFMA
jgi:hypothetical protein